MIDGKVGMILMGVDIIIFLMFNVMGLIPFFPQRKWAAFDRIRLLLDSQTAL